VDMSKYSKDEVKTGLFVLAAVIVFFFLLFMIGAFRTTHGTYPVKILFNFISGLESGAPVRFGGAEVGKVEKVEILPSHEKANIQVTVSVGKNIVLHEDSEVYIDTLGLMGEKYVEVTPGTIDSGILEPGATLKGQDPLAMHTLYKKGMGIAKKLDSTLVELESLLENSNEMIKENRSAIKGIINNIEHVGVDAKSLAGDLKANPWKLFWKTKEKDPNAKTEKKERKKFLGIF